MSFLNETGLGTLWGKIVGKSIPYGYCQTAAGTKAKTVTVSPAITSLETGTAILVRFQYANTSSSPTLNVNNLGAEEIYRYGTTVPSTSAASSWNANAVCLMIYNGSGWILANWNNTTYSSMTVAEYEAGTGTTARVITPARLKGAIEHWATGEANVQADWGETSVDSASFINNKPTIPYRYVGDTSNDTPTDVLNALISGTSGGVSITHTDQTYGALRLDSFDYAMNVGMIVSTTSIYYSGSYLLYVLVGYLSTDTWQAYVTTLAQSTDIPTALSDLTNDVGYITGYTETDPTVPSWAKASTKPTYTASEVGALASTGGQITGDLTLYVASGNSPGIIFQRGTLTDNYNDWKIYDKGGYLYFAQRGSGSSSFGDMGYIDTTGVLHFNIPWGSVSGKPTFATVATSGSYNDLSDKPTIPNGLPSVTTADNGKVLRVVNGAWSAVALPSASGVSF